MCDQDADWLNRAFKLTARKVLCLFGVKIRSSVDLWWMVRVSAKSFDVYMKLIAVQKNRLFQFRFKPIKRR